MTQPKKLRIKKESLKQLTEADLKKSVGGVVGPPPVIYHRDSNSSGTNR